MSLLVPPLKYNLKGELRRVGIELEFAALSARQSAVLVRKHFGGQICELSDHRFRIRGTIYGDFLTELDTRYAHPDWLESESSEDGDSALSQLRSSLTSLLGTLSSVVVPCEIVCPPIELEQLNAIESLVGSLHSSGAKGTEQSVFYAFGLHLNVEIAEDSSEYLTSVIKSYILLSDWLRAHIQIDTTRKLLSYTDPFPIEYVLKVTDNSYWPSLRKLMSDYLEFNSTRNRELDMLPVFAHFDEDLVMTNVGDERVSKRPAFHYRLPNFELTGSKTPIVNEWNRWSKVEHLAHDRRKLTEMADAYHRTIQNEDAKPWVTRVNEWSSKSRR